MLQDWSRKSVTSYEKRALPGNRWPLDQDQHLQMKSGGPALLTVTQRIKEYAHIVPYLFEYDESVTYLSHREERRRSRPASAEEARAYDMIEAVSQAELCEYASEEQKKHE